MLACTHIWYYKFKNLSPQTNWVTVTTASQVVICKNPTAHMQEAAQSL